MNAWSDTKITVTVKAVHKGGSADIESHFDKFEFHSDLADRVPANFRGPAVSAQQEISEHVAGQDIVAHFDRNGKLLGFEGGEGLFEQLDLSYREPLRQALNFFLQQVGGNSLYHEQPVKPAGRMLLALDDGRVLQNHANIHQTLSAHLKSSAPLPYTKSQTLRLEVQSDTEMDMEGSGR
jgi:hypothetical protein